MSILNQLYLYYIASLVVRGLFHSTPFNLNSTSYAFINVYSQPVAFKVHERIATPPQMETQKKRSLFIKTTHPKKSL